MSENKSTALAIVGKGLFKDIDFSGLNKAIDQIGAASKELTAEEKSAGTNIIYEWESSVINRLNLKKSQMHAVIDFFGQTTSLSSFTHEQLLSLAEQTDTIEQYNNIIELNDEIEDIKMEAPEKPVYSQFITEIQNRLNEKEYELLKMKHDKRVSAAIEKKNKAIRTWKAAIRKNPVARELAQKAKEYIDNMSHLVEDCRQKSQYARLNVMIGNETVRTALKDLINFSENLK